MLLEKRHLDNLPSIRNIERAGFAFEKTKRLKTGIDVNVYKIFL